MSDSSDIVADPVETLAERIVARDRTALARAITLVESTNTHHRKLAAALIERLAPMAGQAIRIGISGVPGAGKSTLIDAFGSLLTQMGHRVAVLTVDPSSVRTGGSILGDKTRMDRLARDPNAFIRPSPSAGTLGGVTARTRETMLVCEAAGFDVVLVETVGVGQSEIAVSHMVDVVVLLMVAGTGDGLQGIKKGILESADIVAVNKSDSGEEPRIAMAAAELRSALSIVPRKSSLWSPPVLAISGQSGAGLSDLWTTIQRFRAVHAGDNGLATRRAEQNVRWLWALIDDGLHRLLSQNEAVAAAIQRGEGEVRTGAQAPTAVACDVLDLFLQEMRRSAGS